jgi:hypothetical protein
VGAAWLPGTCTASHPPAASSPAQRAINCPWPGTQCSAALLTSTSTGSIGCQFRRFPVVKSSRPGIAWAAAAASIEGELSIPVTRAPGHRCARVAVADPSPQPRSTTTRGASALTRDSSSAKGRARSPANRR